MRLKGIKDYKEANRYLEGEFLPWYNNNYNISVESTYRYLPKSRDLDLIFTIRQQRKVNKDNTIKFKGKVYQLLPLNGIKSFSGKWVEVCKYEEERIRVLFEGKEVVYLEVLDKEALREEKGVLDKREYFEKKEAKKEKWRSSKDHPWRKTIKFNKVKDVTF